MSEERTALVLSGGGARGAYEVGAVAGLVDVLGRVPLDVLAGTSVGAINATYLASQLHRDDLGVGALQRLWSELTLRRYLRPARRPWRQRAALDVRPFEQVVRDGVDWAGLARNRASGRLRALFVAALEVDSGRTTVFGDLGEGTRWSPSPDPRRVPVRARIGWQHVLASAAIPGVFPPRRVGGRLYYDGGLRFNTPIAPVLRAGATRVVVVSPLHRGDEPHPPMIQPGDISPLFLVGKMLHAVLLDPFAYDLEVLERFNHLIATLDGIFTPEERARFDARVLELRGAPYRTVRALVLSPSEDLGHLALRFLRRHRRGLLREGPGGLALALATGRLERSGTDLISYLLFDGRFTAELIALGRADVQARAAEVRAFFTP